MGFPFLRQRPVGKYIADFLCKELNLIIETDGLTHEWKENITKDKFKNSELQSLGFTVLRFKDEEVVYKIEKVKIKIEDWINAHSLSPAMRTKNLKISN